MRFPQFIILSSILVVSVYSQTAILTGAITDENGGVIPGAEVEVIGKDGKLFQGSANSEGIYRIGLPGGLYKISFLRPPFTKFVVADYMVPESGSMTLDVALRCVGCQILEDLVPPSMEFIESTPTEINTVIRTRPFVEKAFEEIKTETVVLTGRVSDKDGNVIPAVKVTGRNSSGKKYIAITNGKGEYSFPLPIGVYRFEFKTRGFKPIYIRYYLITSTHQENGIRLDVRMELRAVWIDE